MNVASVETVNGRSLLVTARDSGLVFALMNVMRFIPLAVVASLALLANTASADPPAWPLPFPQVTLPNVPPIDLNALAKAVQTCPPVEIAPGIFVPIPCAAALPKVPDDAPTIELPTFAVSPSAVDLRTQNMDGPVKDQQQTGVCFAFALTSVLENSLRRQGRAEVLSPLHIVAADAWDDLWTGKPKEAIAQEISWPYDPIKACKLLSEHDSCEQSYGVQTSSWQSDPVIVADRARVRGQGVVWTGRAQVLKKNPVEQMVTALAAGREVYVNIEIDSAAWGWRGVRGGVLPDYQVADRGGHAVAIVGYRSAGAGRQFLIHNSWGRGWGDGGYAWISEQSLRSHLMSAYLVDALASNAQPPPAPAPVAAAPTIATCAPGTAYDLGAGKCAATCPSGLAQFGGRCWL